MSACNASRSCHAGHASIVVVCQETRAIAGYMSAKFYEHALTIGHVNRPHLVRAFNGTVHFQGSLTALETNGFAWKYCMKAINDPRPASLSLLRQQAGAHEDQMAQSREIRLPQYVSKFHSLMMTAAPTWKEVPCVFSKCGKQLTEHNCFNGVCPKYGAFCRIRGPRDRANARILVCFFKAPHKRDSRNHGFGRIFMFMYRIQYTMYHIPCTVPCTIYHIWYTTYHIQHTVY